MGLQEERNNTCFGVWPEERRRRYGQGVWMSHSGGWSFSLYWRALMPQRVLLLRVACVGGALWAALICSAVWGEMGTSPLLMQHLHQSGEQLDLRSACVKNEDLAQLEDPVFGNVKVVLLPRTVGDAGLQHLRHLHVREIDLYRTAVTDAGMAHLQELPLERLILTGTAITDEGLFFLKGLPITLLILRDTAITDQGLIALHGLPLTFLDLSFTDVTDAGLMRLQDLSQLKTLDLSNTTITDEGLDYLVPISNLSTVNFASSGVTLAGLANFKALRPDIQATIKLPTR